MPIKLRYTLTTLVFAVVYVLVVIVFGLDIFEKLLSFLKEMEHLELDEVIIPLICILFAIIIDFFVWREWSIMRDKNKRLQEELNMKCEDISTKLVRNISTIQNNNQHQSVVNNVKTCASQIKNLSRDLKVLHEDEVKGASAYMRTR